MNFHSTTAQSPRFHQIRALISDVEGTLITSAKLWSARRNAAAALQGAVNFVTASNDDDGFAAAVEHHLLRTAAPIWSS